MQKVKVRKFVNSVFGSNTYVIHDGCEAVIVDAGDLVPVPLQNAHPCPFGS